MIRRHHYSGQRKFSLPVEGSVKKKHHHHHHHHEEPNANGFQKEQRRVRPLAVRLFGFYFASRVNKKNHGRGLINEIVSCLIINLKKKLQAFYVKITVLDVCPNLEHGSCVSWLLENYFLLSKKLQRY